MIYTPVPSTQTGRHKSERSGGGGGGGRGVGGEGTRKSKERESVIIYFIRPPPPPPPFDFGCQTFQMSGDEWLIPSGCKNGVGR